MTITESAPISSQSKVMRYFFDLPDQRAINATALQHYWGQIGHFDFSANHLIALLSSLSKANKRSIVARTLSLQCWEDKATRQISEFDPNGLANILASFTTLRRVPSNRFLNLWFQQARITFDRFTPRDLTQSFYALARLAIIPGPRMIKMWQDRMLKELHFFSTREKVDMLKSLAIIDCIHPCAENYFFAKAINDSLGLVEDDVRIRGMLYDARAWFGFEHALQRPIESTSNNRYEISVLEAFRENRFDITHGYEAPEFKGHTFDYFLQADGAPFIIELDGGPHYNRNTFNARILDGGTFLQSALVEQALPSYPLIRIPVDTGDFIIRNMSYKKTRRAFMDFLAVSAGSPGRFMAPTLYEGATIKAEPIFDGGQIKARRETRALRAA